MSPDEMKSKIKGIISGSSSPQLYLVLRINNELTLRLADIEDAKTAPEIRDLFVNSLNNTIINNEELSIHNLSVADEIPNAVYRYDYESYPEELGIFRDFDIISAIDAPKFNFDSDDLDQLFGYIIYLGSMENGVVLFKKHYPIALIKRDSFLLGAIKSKSRFERLSENDVIRLNDSIQLLRIENEIYVLDLKMLERNMGFSALIQKAAAESIGAIEELQLLEDIEVLRDTLEEVSFSRKLSKIKKSSPIFLLGISKAAILEFTKTTPELAGKFKYNNDGTRIRLDTKKSKLTFLKLMNDSFLHSELTKQYYEAIAKDNITRKAE